jgi:hypothetical protein
MSAEVDDALVRELTEPLVADLSPAEQGELFDLLSEAHFASPEAYANRARASDPLTFGLPELTVLLTPVVLAAMKEVVGYIIAVAMSKGVRVTAGAIRRLLGRRRGAVAPDPVDGDDLVLSDTQWAEIHRIVEQVAAKGGVPADQAELMADAVVGRGRSGRGGA